MDRHLHNAMMAQYVTPKVSGDGLVSWNKGVKCVMPSVKLYGAAAQDGMPTPDAPIMPVCNDGVFQAASPDGTWDGGQATAPELWAIPGMDIRDEWDCQTGKGIRRVNRVILTGKENWALYTKSCVMANTVPKIATNTKYIVSHGGNVKNSNASYKTLQFGDGSQRFQDYWGFTNVDDWKAYLAAQYAAGTPVTVWYALAEPEPFYHPPARLTQPHGPGQVIQVSGSVSDCPIEASYLTHS